jgi:hypothetical protein
MDLRRIRVLAWRIAPIVLAWSSLVGCNSSILSGDRGPSPILSAPDVLAASENANAILAGLASDNNIDINSSTGWYYVSVAGFNYVDDQCNSYFDHLFYLNREKDTVTGLLNSAGQTTSAILAVTKATSVTLAVVSQAFGFSSSATQLVAGTFLYQLPPSTTLGFVTKLQTAFRTGAADQAQRGFVRTRGDSYHLIQQYLALCLPPTIEAEIVKQVSGTQAEPDAKSPPGSVSVLTGSAPPASVPAVAANAPSVRPVAPKLLISKPDEPLPPQPHPAPRVPDGANKSESEVFVSDLDKIQAALCLTPDGRFGPVTPKSQTRRNIDDYLKGRQASGAIDANGALNDRGISKLYDAIAVGDCRRAGFDNAYEVGFYGVPVGESKNKITGFQEAIQETLGTKNIADAEQGTFGPTTRRDIANYRNSAKQLLNPQADSPDNEQLDPVIAKCIRLRRPTCP